MTVLYWADDPNLNYSDRYAIGPFKYRQNAGEGGSNGFEIDASGSGIYNILRPEPIPVNDGLAFSLQAVVESTLTLNGSNQGFAQQVRGVRATDTDVTQTWISDPDSDPDTFWYGRQDPGFVFVTNTFILPRNIGTTHLLIEPMVHAASGQCRITSVRMRTHYQTVLRYNPGTPAGINSVTAIMSGAQSDPFFPGDPNRFNYSPYSQSVEISAGQELQFDLANTTIGSTFAGSAHLLVAVQLQGIDGNYDYVILHHAYAQNTTIMTPIDFSRMIVAQKQYKQVKLLFGLAQPDPTGALVGEFYIRNIDFKMQLKDIIVSGY